MTGDDILAAVDGEGVRPAPVKTEPKADRKQPKQVQAKTNTEARQPAHVDRAAQAESAKENVSNADDPLTRLEGFFGADQEQGSDDPAVGQDGEQPSEREQSRMQALANRTRAAEQRAEAAVRESQQMMRRFEQQMGELSRQNHYLAGQLRMLTQGRETENLDPAERIERDIIEKATADARKRMSPEFQALRNELETLKQERAQERRRAEIQANKQQYASDAQAAARDVVLKGLPEEVAQQFMGDATDMVLATAWGKRTNMANAAKIVRERLRGISLAFVRAAANGNQPSRDLAKAAPKAPPQARESGSGEPEPSLAQLRAAGYRGLLPMIEWEQDGRPALPPLGV